VERGDCVSPLQVRADVSHPSRPHSVNHRCGLTSAKALHNALPRNRQRWAIGQGLKAIYTDGGCGWRGSHAEQEADAELEGEARLLAWAGTKTLSEYGGGAGRDELLRCTSEAGET
jgi:hypothetical protein